ncbi:DNA-packaging protein [Terrarubrum flagellatum]|uniref:DNA-packaging protein n=1 Tax=Terrirubrum flagellatum TaxID=2895980 RepID=UPI0031451D29
MPLCLKTALSRSWAFQGRDDQLPPEGDWTIWLMLGGRGAGKTRAGAEWVKALALGLPPFAERPASPIALVGETAADVREVMIDGVSGLRAIHARDQRPAYEATRRRLVWPNGAVAQCFSAEDPDQLRGPQFAAAWADELAKWRYADAAWDNLQFGLRLGDKPREMVTTTPRPIPLLKKLMSDPRVALTRAKTSANQWFLAPAFLDAVVSRYVGTRLGRQELDGEMIEECEGALFSREMIERSRIDAAPSLARIVVAVDPPASSGKRADACGIVAAGVDAQGHIFVLADETAQRVRPSEWAERALSLYRRLEADAVVAEINQGGEMVMAVLREADAGVPVTPVRATRGKYLRAEPVAQAMEQGRIRFVGAFPALEDEMCDFSAAGLSSGRSPDRLDAFVWAASALMRDERSGPRIRTV